MLVVNVRGQKAKGIFCQFEVFRSTSMVNQHSTCVGHRRIHHCILDRQSGRISNELLLKGALRNDSR